MHASRFPPPQKKKAEGKLAGYLHKIKEIQAALADKK
jgi:hypothetical protein